MPAKIVKMWTGCELYLPLEIEASGESFVVRFPEFGDSLTMPFSGRLDKLIAELEAGESLRAWQVMGWAICSRRNRWMRAAAARRNE